MYGRNPFSGILIGGISQSRKKDSRRAFSKTQKTEIWDRQKGKCARCHKPLKMATVEYDHVKQYSRGGSTRTSNGRALCKNCHGIVTHKSRLKKIDKKRQLSSQFSPFSMGYRPKNLIGWQVVDMPKKGHKRGGKLRRDEYVTLGGRIRRNKRFKLFG